jgi:PPOX class probable F420-dependent enzyme
MRMTHDMARALLDDARVARFATVDADGAPHLVPVTFAVIDAAHPASTAMIVFAVDHKPKSSTALRRLANIAANPRVCFLVDFYDDDWTQLWWVRADATAKDLDGAQRAAAIAALQAKYPQYQQVPPTGVVVGCTVTGLRGWRFTAP